MKPQSDESRRVGQRAPSAVVLHARARESASELRKLFVSLSSGAIAAFYLALTSRIDPVLTSAQKITVIFSIVCFGACILFGALQWQADVKRNYYWANALEEQVESLGNHHYKKRDTWLRVRRMSGVVLRTAFIFGVLGALAYVVERVLAV